MVPLRSALFLAGAILLAFGGCVWGPLVLDDHSLFLDPGLLSPGGWREVLLPTQTRPLTWLSFWLNFRISTAPWTLHLVSLLLHLASALVALNVLRRWLPPVTGLFAAVVFALHPVQTEAVVYVYARATLLSGLLSLLALKSWTEGRPWKAVTWFTAALLAKEEAAALPLALAWLAWWRRPAFPYRAPLGLMAALSLASGLRVIWAAAALAGSGAGAGAGISPWNYFLAQGLAIWRYLRLLVIPVGLTIESPLDVPPVPLGVALWTGLLCLAVLVTRLSGPWFAAGLLLLASSSSVFPAADLSADRRVYLMVPFAAAAVGVWLAGRIRPKWVLVLAAVLAGTSAISTAHWLSEEKLWRRARELAPNKVRPLRQLARITEPATALKFLQQAAELAPEDADVAGDLGRTYLRLQDPVRALAEFGRALALTPAAATAVNNRGVALTALGQVEAGLQDFRRAAQLDPCLFDAHWNLKQAGAPRPGDAACRWTPEQRRAMAGN
jgi:tetratricopeptide (TPR) repeat protein